MPQDEDWLDRIESLTQDIVCSEHDTLACWTVTVQTLKTQGAAKGNNEKVIFHPQEKVDVGIYDSFDNPVMTNHFLQTAYTNIGIEPRVGASKYLSKQLNLLQYSYRA